MYCGFMDFFSPLGLIPVNFKNLYPNRNFSGLSGRARKTWALPENHEKYPVLNQNKLDAHRPELSPKHQRLYTDLSPYLFLDTFTHKYSPLQHVTAKTP